MAINPITPVMNIASGININPIRKIDSVEQLRTEGFSTDKNNQPAPVLSFADILDSAIRETNVTDTVTKIDAFDLAAGNAGDDLHTIEINAVKAELALQTLISVRNKALEAYQEIMRITL